MQQVSRDRAGISWPPNRTFLEFQKCLPRYIYNRSAVWGRKTFASSRPPEREAKWGEAPSIPHTNHVKRGRLKAAPVFVNRCDFFSHLSSSSRVRQHARMLFTDGALVFFLHKHCAQNEHGPNSKFEKKISPHAFHLSSTSWTGRVMG